MKKTIRSRKKRLDTWNGILVATAKNSITFSSEPKKTGKRTFLSKETFHWKIFSRHVNCKFDTTLDKSLSPNSGEMLVKDKRKFWNVSLFQKKSFLPKLVPDTYNGISTTLPKKLRLGKELKTNFVPKKSPQKDPPETQNAVLFTPLEFFSPKVQNVLVQAWKNNYQNSSRIFFGTCNSIWQTWREQFTKTQYFLLKIREKRRKKNIVWENVAAQLQGMRPTLTTMKDALMLRRNSNIY